MVFNFHVCTAGAIGLRRAPFGPGLGPIHLDNVNCTGTENSLTNCMYNPQHDCNHGDDAWDFPVVPSHRSSLLTVVSQNPKDLRIRTN